MIIAGEVLVDGVAAAKPGMRCPVESLIELRPRSRGMSRVAE